MQLSCIENWVLKDLCGPFERMHVGELTQITWDCGQTSDKLIKERIDSPPPLKMLGLHLSISPSETMLKIPLWSEDVRITIRLTPPFWGIPWRKNVTRKLRSIVLWRQNMNWLVAKLPQRAVVTGVWHLCLILTPHKVWMEVQLLALSGLVWEVNWIRYS